MRAVAPVHSSVEPFSGDQYTSQYSLQTGLYAQYPVTSINNRMRNCASLLARSNGYGTTDNWTIDPHARTPATTDPAVRNRASIGHTQYAFHTHAVI